MRDREAIPSEAGREESNGLNAAGWMEGGKDEFDGLKQ